MQLEDAKKGMQQALSDRQAADEQLQQTDAQLEAARAEIAKLTDVRCLPTALAMFDVASCGERSYESLSFQITSLESVLVHVCLQDGKGALQDAKAQFAEAVGAGMGGEQRINQLERTVVRLWIKSQLYPLPGCSLLASAASPA